MCLESIVDSLYLMNFLSAYFYKAFYTHYLQIHKKTQIPYESSDFFALVKGSQPPDSYWKWISTKDCSNWRQIPIWKMPVFSGILYSLSNAHEKMKTMKTKSTSSRESIHQFTSQKDLLLCFYFWQTKISLFIIRWPLPPSSLRSFNSWGYERASEMAVYIEKADSKRIKKENALFKVMRRFSLSI